MHHCLDGILDTLMCVPTGEMIKTVREQGHETLTQRHILVLVTVDHC